MVNFILYFVVTINYNQVVTFHIITQVAQYNNTGSCEIIKPKRIGRLRAFDDKELVLAYLKKNPDASGKEMQEALAPNISDTAFYNSLARMNISYKKKRSNIKSVVSKKEQNLLNK